MKIKQTKLIDNNDNQNTIKRTTMEKDVRFQSWGLTVLLCLAARCICAMQKCQFEPKPRSGRVARGVFKSLTI